MQLTLHTDYSFRILIYLGARGEICQISDIADFYNISFNHLTKAVHNLSQQGILKSHRGRSGGIELGMDPAKINLRKVLEACEPSFTLVECMGENNACVITPACSLKGVLGKARLAFLTELEGHTLADLLSTQGKNLKKMISAQAEQSR